MSATLKEVAERTGLSISAVSRALNPKPDRNARVSERTRSLVAEAAAKLGFRHNRAAQSLKRGKQPSIGVFLPEYSNRLIADLVMGLSEVASEEGFPLSFHFGLTKESYDSFFRNVEAEAHSGIVSYPHALLSDEAVARRVREYRKRGGALVALNTDRSFPGVPVVDIDDGLGGTIAAKHLIERGCRTLACFQSFPRRTAAFLSVAKSAGVPCAALESTKEVLAWMSAVPEARRAKLKAGVFATTDRDALDLLPGIKALGFEPGRSLLLVGYDDLDLTDLSDPPLTTVSQPFREEGRIAMRKLINLLDGKAESSTSLAPTLVRRST